MRTEAQKRADKKYHEKTYKTFTVNAKIADYEKIEKYCNDKSISKAQLIIAACIEYINKHDNKYNLKD